MPCIWVLGPFWLACSRFLGTWAPKVRKIMALRTVLGGSTDFSGAGVQWSLRSKAVSLLYRPGSQHPQLHFKRPQIPSNRDHKGLNRGTLGVLGLGGEYAVPSFCNLPCLGRSSFVLYLQGAWA